MCSPSSRRTRCEILTQEGMAGGLVDAFVCLEWCRDLGSLYLTIPLPFALFSSLAVGSLPVGFPFCESVLPSINRPFTQSRLHLGQTQRRSHRSSEGALSPVAGSEYELLAEALLLNL